MGFHSSLSPLGWVSALIICGCSGGELGSFGPGDLATSGQGSVGTSGEGSGGSGGSVHAAAGSVSAASGSKGGPAASGSSVGSSSASGQSASGSSTPEASGMASSGSAIASGTSSGDAASGSSAGSGATSGATTSGLSESGVASSGQVASGSPSGASGSASGSAGGVPCKRGIASDAAPSNALAPTASAPGVGWWYNWGTRPASGASPAIEFDPMMANAGAVNSSIPSGSKYLLGFNEPDFKAQGDLSPQQAAADWPALQAKAKAAGIPIVSPGVNFCGSASNTSQCTTPSITDPYTWLKDFFAACTGCEVDYVAIHWYNCDLPSLQTYIEGDNKGTFEGFTQFGKPIWVTEFSCDATHSVADQTAYMEAAVPYLEGNPSIFRYSWFSADPIPNAELENSDGSLTALGTTYVGLAQSCHP
jgi:hypothetical protein